MFDILDELAALYDEITDGNFEGEATVTERAAFHELARRLVDASRAVERGDEDA